MKDARHRGVPRLARTRRHHGYASSGTCPRTCAASLPSLAASPPIDARALSATWALQQPSPPPQVLPDGRVAFIDFGIVGRISEGTWRGLEALLVATTTQDYDTMVRAGEGPGVDITTQGCTQGWMLQKACTRG